MRTESNGPPRHGRDAIGRRLSIQFDAGSRTRWYSGMVIAYDAGMAKHHTRFDDGDTRWIDLKAEEDMNQLRWTAAPASCGVPRQVHVPLPSPLSDVRTESSESDVEQAMVQTESQRRWVAMAKTAEDAARREATHLLRAGRFHTPEFQAATSRVKWMLELGLELSQWPPEDWSGYEQHNESSANPPVVQQPHRWPRQFKIRVGRLSRPGHSDGTRGVRATTVGFLRQHTWNRGADPVRRHRQWIHVDGQHVSSAADAISFGLNPRFFHFEVQAKQLGIAPREMRDRWSFDEPMTGRLHERRQFWVGTRKGQPPPAGGSRWCRWGQGPTGIRLESSHFTGVCKPPAHPQVRMWNFFLACAAPTPFRPNPGPALRAGRRWWTKRESVRQGDITRPTMLTWTQQDVILTLEQKHVIYLLAPKRQGMRAYVGVTARGAWDRMTTRINSLFTGTGQPKPLPPDDRRGIDMHVQRVGLRSLLHDHYIIVLEHVPPLPNEGADAWVSRVRPYEKWWINYLDVGLRQRGWNIDHTKAARGLGETSKVRRDGALRRSRGTRGSKPMKWARAKGRTGRLHNRPPPPPAPQAPCSHSQKQVKHRKRYARQHQKRCSQITVDRIKQAMQQGDRAMRVWANTVGMTRIRHALHLARMQRDKDDMSKRVWEMMTKMVEQSMVAGPPRDCRPLIVGGYLGAGVERLRLPSLIASEQVASLIPVMVQKILGRPLLCYKYHTSLLQLLCNWAAASRGAGSKEPTCPCSRSEWALFCHAETGHVITKDVKITKSTELQELLQRGPGYRMRSVDPREVSEAMRARHPNWSVAALKLVSMVEDALDRFAEKSEDILGIDRLTFLPWMTEILREVELRIPELTPEEEEEITRWEPQETGWSESTQAEVKRLQRLFVIEVADKETGTFTFTCRKHWEEMLWREVRATPNYVMMGKGAQQFILNKEGRSVREVERCLRRDAPYPDRPVPSPSHTRVPSLHVGEVDRVLRASHIFGVLGVPVWSAERPPTRRQLQEAREEVLADLEATRRRSDAQRWQQACNRVEAVGRLIENHDNAVNQWTALKAQSSPVVHTLTCPIDIPALQTYASSQEGQAMLTRSDGTPLGKSGAQVVNEFLHGLSRTLQDGTGEIDLQYRHSPLGADAVAAGFVVASRVYARGADPFKLPSSIRHLALARFGLDFDDTASYPHALRALTTVGRQRASQLLQHREAILQAIGLFFFEGAGLTAVTLRSRAKRLINLLDMDGTFAGWLRSYADARADRRLADARLQYMAQGASHIFDLAAYVGEQLSRTASIAHAAPRFLRFMQLAQRLGDRTTPPERTLKSYVLQELEAFSRHGKMDWCAQTGAKAINLQHDGIVIQLAENMTDTRRALQELREAASGATGYDQPVDIKEWKNGTQPTVFAKVARAQPTGLTYVNVLRSQCQYAQSRGMLKKWSTVRRSAEWTAAAGGGIRGGDEEDEDGGNTNLERALTAAVNKYKLPYLYGTIKTHKQPFGWRFIAGGQDVALNLVGDWVHRALAAILPDVHTMARETMMGKLADDQVPCEDSFIIKDSRDVVRRIRDLERRRRAQLDRHRQGTCNSPPPPWQQVEFSVHDFSTLYTTLPHDHINHTVGAVIDEVFTQRELRAGERCWLAVNSSLQSFAWKKGTRTAQGRVERPTVTAKTWRIFDAEEIKKDIRFILDNTFVTVGDEIHRGVCGVPMGLTCSPMLAVIMLAHYEIEQLRRMVRTAEQANGTQIETPKGMVTLDDGTRRAHLDLAARFSRCCRAIDDVLLINITNEEAVWLLARTYPTALELKMECCSPAMIKYLDMEIRHDRGGFYTTLYDKRDALRGEGKMGNVRRFPHHSSVLSRQCKYAVLTTFLHRINRVCMRRKHFIRCAVERMVEMRDEGYDVRRLRGVADRFVKTYVPHASARQAMAAAIRRQVPTIPRIVD